METTPDPTSEAKEAVYLPALTDPAVTTLVCLDERNRIAREIIRKYANRHAAMDITVGVIGIVPFLAVPALLAAIAAQAPVIYQPMARELAKVYRAESGELEKARDFIIQPMAQQTGYKDVAADYGTAFMMQIASELLLEAGWGGLGATVIPVLGGVVGAALDYLIATQMTWRVGAMVSMYFQNGGAWVESRKHTFELAKGLTGPMSVGLGDLLTGKFKNHTPRVDLNDIRKDVPAVRQKLLATVRLLVGLLRAAAGDEKVREILKAKGIPLDLINLALSGIR
jgi:hypothetical protein